MINDDNKKKIEEITEAKYGDLVVLEIPTSIMVHCGSMCGDDYAVGYFERHDDENVYLCRRQKIAQEEEETRAYAKEDITSYEILRRFEPDPFNDGLDELLVSTEVVEGPKEWYE